MKNSEAFQLLHLTQRDIFIFYSEFIRNHAFSGWFDKPKTMDDLLAFDFNKHYSSCFMGEGILSVGLFIMTKSRFAIMFII